jgi:hypothetical protein
LAAVGRTVFTFGLICIGWVFFRSDSISHAVIYLMRIGQGYPLALPTVTLFPLRWIALMLLIEWLQREKTYGLDIQRLATPLRWGIYYILVLLILLYGSLEHAPFIYFQF